jgi:hypothetical protein
MIRRLAAAVGLIFFVNLAAYMSIAVMIGGDAINGTSGGGRYFLAMHGKLTEVSHETFLYSQWHTWILWANAALAMALNLPRFLAGKLRTPSSSTPR